MNDVITYDQLLYAFEHDDIFSIDETVIYFIDEDESRDVHYIGCLRQYDKPYWAGLCDIPGGTEFATAEELFTAKIYDGLSIKDRWDKAVVEQIGLLSAEGWMDIHASELKYEMSKERKQANENNS